MKKIYLIIALFSCALSMAQAEDAMKKLESRMDGIEAFTVDVKLETDIDFIQMPVKHARMFYERNNPVKVESDDFVLIPKRGLDLVLSEIFRYDYIAVPRGEEDKNGVTCTKLNVIPDDKRTAYAIATLYLDTQENRLVEAEIQTRKEGMYTVSMFYSQAQDILPERVEVSFEVEKVKIPIRYLAREGEVDKDAYRSDGVKKGKVILYLSDYEIALTE